MLPVAPAVAPLAAAEVLAVRVALGRARVVGERVLRPAPAVSNTHVDIVSSDHPPPVPAPQPHPVPHPVRGGPVVHARRALAVVRARPAVTPVGAAVVLDV